MKKLLLIPFILLSLLAFSACTTDATKASYNLSKAAEMFEIDRRVIFYNGITGGYMLTIEGKCSVDAYSRQLEVTCKTGPKEYKKHFLGLSDNVTWFAEQLRTHDVSVYHHRIIFKPQSIIPDIDFRGSSEELVDSVIPDNSDN